MSLYSWQVFVTVAEERSFVRAADVLSVSQSAVSHVIAKMEAEYGYPLFVRDRNNIELTSNGRLLMPYVRNLLATSGSLEQQLADLSSVNKGEVKIASFNSLAAMWLPEIIKQYNKEYPDVEVSVRQTGDIHIEEMINAGELDLAFLSRQLAGKRDFLPLHRTPIVCLTPKDFVPKNGKSVTVKDLEGVPLILQSEGYDTEMMCFLKENGADTTSIFRIEVDSTCHSYVEKGFGFCLAAQMTFDCNPAEVAIWPVEPAWYRDIGIITVFPNYISPAANAFKQKVIDYFDETGLRNL